MNFCCQHNFVFPLPPHLLPKYLVLLYFQVNHRPFPSCLCHFPFITCCWVDTDAWRCTTDIHVTNKPFLQSLTAHLSSWGIKEKLTVCQWMSIWSSTLMVHRSACKIRVTFRSIYFKTSSMSLFRSDIAHIYLVSNYSFFWSNKKQKNNFCIQDILLSLVCKIQKILHINVRGQNAGLDNQIPMTPSGTAWRWQTLDFLSVL